MRVQQAAGTTVTLTPSFELDLLFSSSLLLSVPTVLSVYPCLLTSHLFLHRHQQPPVCLFVPFSCLVFLFHRPLSLLSLPSFKKNMPKSATMNQGAVTLSHQIHASFFIFSGQLFGNTSESSAKLGTNGPVAFSIISAAVYFCLNRCRKT